MEMDSLVSAGTSLVATDLDENGRGVIRVQVRIDILRRKRKISDDGSKIRDVFGVKRVLFLADRDQVLSLSRILYSMARKMKEVEDKLKSEDTSEDTSDDKGPELEQELPPKEETDHPGS